MIPPGVDVLAARVCTALAAVFFLPATYISALKPRYRQWRNVLCCCGSVFVFGAAWFYKDPAMFMAEIPYLLLSLYGLFSSTDSDAGTLAARRLPECQCAETPDQAQ